MRAGLIDAGGAMARSRPASDTDLAALHDSLDPGRTARQVARVLLGVAGARSCGVWAVDGRVPTALAGATVAGDAAGFEGATVASPAVSEAAAALRPVFTDSAGDVLLAPDALGPLLLVPLHGVDEVVAVAALDGGGRPLRPESVAAIGEASRSAATALANARAHARQAAKLAAAERQVERLEVLHDLGAAVVERATTDTLVERVNRLLGGRGLEVEGLAWKSRELARRIGGNGLTPQERALLRGSAKSTALPDGRVAVALRAGEKALGAMRVRREDGTGDTAFLELVATAVAEVADRMSLRADLDDAARGAALAGERDRIATGLHDTAGQLFVAIRMLARREAEQLPPASEAAARLHRLADLAEQGKWEIDHAIDALALFPAARHGLAPALRSLGSSYHSDGDLDVIVDVYGGPLRLPAPAERALYRVAHESLANARQARCSVVRVALTFDAEGVHLEVADDGTALTRTIPDRGRPGTGSMRRAVAEAGGIFHIRSARPRGVVIEAVIPTERP